MYSVHIKYRSQTIFVINTCLLTPLHAYNLKPPVAMNLETDHSFFKNFHLCYEIGVWVWAST